jgi:5-methylcytosine-specific restriction endonuclease McrA
LKRCPRCSVEKPLSEFVQSRNRANGVAAYCKSCYRQYYATYVQPPKPCLVEGCSVPARSRGCCSRHYQQWRKGQLVVEGLPTKAPTVCTVDGCNGSVVGWGWCNKHYHRWKKYGDPLGKPVIPVFCAAEGCNTPVGKSNFVGHGWCSKHYQRWKKHGDPLGGGPGPKVRVSVVSADGMKTCTRCEKELFLERFYRDRNGHGGFRSICKACTSSKMKNWYGDNQERQRDRQRVRFAANNAAIREGDKERYRRNREARIQLATEVGHRRRTRLKGAERADAGINHKELRERDGSQCCHCGVEMSFDTLRRGEYEPRRATIEHIIPICRGGLHVWDNVALACWECNIRRGARGSRAAGSDGTAGCIETATGVPAATLSVTGTPS